MMKVYKRHFRFTMDGKKHCDCSSIFLAEEHEVEKKEFKGETFQSLWDLMETYDLVIPGNQWTRGMFSKKRRIEFFHTFKTWKEDGSVRPWTFECYDKEFEHATLQDIMKYRDYEKAIKFFKERGLTIPNSCGIISI